MGGGRWEKDWTRVNDNVQEDVERGGVEERQNRRGDSLSLIGFRVDKGFRIEPLTEGEGLPQLDWV